jgi:exonuclease III
MTAGHLEDTRISGGRRLDTPCIPHCAMLYLIEMAPLHIFYESFPVKSPKEREMIGVEGRSPMRIRLMSYNVQDFFLNLDFPVTKDLLRQLNEAEWQLLAAPGEKLKPLAKLLEIASIIEREDPDIIGFNEIGGRTALDLFNKLFLNERYEVFQIPSPSERGIENGFLVRAARSFLVSLLTHQNHRLSFRYPHEVDPVGYSVTALLATYLNLGDPNDRRLSRDMPALVLSSNSGRFLLAIQLVHLKSAYDPHGIDLGGAVRRAAEVDALLEIRQQLHATYAVPVVIMGDFNGQASRLATDPEFRVIYQQTDLEDVLELLQLPRHERITQLSFFAREVHAKQLDYIFLPKILQPSLITQETYVYRYTSGPEQEEILLPFNFQDRALLPSDHYPVLCTFEISDTQ